MYETTDPKSAGVTMGVSPAVTPGPPVVARDVVADPTAPFGYRLDPDLDVAFRAAASRLRAYEGVPGSSGLALRCDLVLEGGGVKGIGLVGAIVALADAGYSFPRIAGTSAGAVVGVFVAAVQRAGRPLTSLLGYLDGLRPAVFAAETGVRHWLDGKGRATRLLADATLLSNRPGLHSGAAFERWLRPILHDDLGVRSFADLRITLDDDPDMSLPAVHRYRLVVHAADITRGQLVRLPWDYQYYGLPADAQDVVSAVRASMSIPLFFEPVTVQTQPAIVDIPHPRGHAVQQSYAGGTVTWVDGGLLQNFPIHCFDRYDGEPSRWPTFGVRLSSQPREFPLTAACDSAVAVAVSCMHTALNEWDRYDVDHTSAARTIYVDNLGLSATDFDVEESRRAELFVSGVRAGAQFVIDRAEAIPS